MPDKKPHDDASYGQSNPSMPYTDLKAGDNGTEGSHMRETPNANPNKQTEQPVSVEPKKKS